MFFPLNFKETNFISHVPPLVLGTCGNMFSSLDHFVNETIFFFTMFNSYLNEFQKSLLFHCRKYLDPSFWASILDGPYRKRMIKQEIKTIKIQIRKVTTLMGITSSCRIKLNKRNLWCKNHALKICKTSWGTLPTKVWKVSV